MPGLEYAPIPLSLRALAGAGFSLRTRLVQLGDVLCQQLVAAAAVSPGGAFVGLDDTPFGVGEQDDVVGVVAEVVEVAHQRPALDFRLVCLPVKPQPLLTPQHAQGEGGCRQQRPKPHGEEGGLAVQQHFGFVQVHLRHHGPGCVRHLAQRGQHRNSPVAHSMYRSYPLERFPRCRRQRRPGRWPGLQRPVLPAPQPADQQVGVSLAPQERNLTAAGRNWPGLDQRIKRLRRVDLENEDRGWGALRGQQWNEQTQVGTPRGSALLEIRQHGAAGAHSLRPQIRVVFRRGGGACGNSDPSLAIDQNGVRVSLRVAAPHQLVCQGGRRVRVGAFQDLAHARPRLGVRRNLPRVLEPLGPPGGDLADFRVRDGGKLLSYSLQDCFALVKKVPVTRPRNPYGHYQKDPERQEKARTRGIGARRRKPPLPDRTSPPVASIDQCSEQVPHSPIARHASERAKSIITPFEMGSSRNCASIAPRIAVSVPGAPGGAGKGPPPGPDPLAGCHRDVRSHHPYRRAVAGPCGGELPPAVRAGFRSPRRGEKHGRIR